MKKAGIWGLILLLIGAIGWGIYYLAKNWKNIFYGPEGTTSKNPVIPGTTTQSPPSTVVQYMGVPVTVQIISALFAGEADAETINGWTYIYGQYVSVNGTSTFQPIADQAAVESYIQTNYNMDAQQVAASLGISPPN